MKESECVYTLTLGFEVGLFAGILVRGPSDLSGVTASLYADRYFLAVYVLPFEARVGGGLISCFSPQKALPLLHFPCFVRVTPSEGQTT